LEIEAAANSLIEAITTGFGLYQVVDSIKTQAIEFVPIVAFKLMASAA